MKTIRKFLTSAAIPTLLGTLIILLSLSTCQKFEPEGFLFITTDTSQALGGGDYKLIGSVVEIGSDEISQHGFCWSEQRNPTTTGLSTQLGSRETTGDFSSTISGLSPTTSYYYRAYVITSAGTEYAEEKSFLTEAILPTVITSDIGNVTETSAVVGGSVTSDGGASVTERGVYYGTSSDPVTTGTKVALGSNTGSFSATLSELTHGTEYFYVAYATNSAGTAFGATLSFVTPLISTVTDVEGNVYPVVVIGDQMWMAENLKVTHYADGEPLTYIEDTPNWDITSPTDKVYSWFDYEGSNGQTYGALYSWAAALDGENGSDSNPSGVQGVCPDGWHIPSDAEWKEMEIYLGMNPAEADKINWRGTNEGGKLKSMDPLWIAPNLEASNESGFSALPGGYIQQNGMSVHQGYWAVFWTATEYSGGEAWHRNLLNNYAQVYRYFYDMRGGFSVRCIRD